MSAQKRIAESFEHALRLPLPDRSRYILFSDCHRGSGTAGDNFLKNEYLYLAALDHYYRNGFTYLELGDGDELWENRSIRKIKAVHGESFEMMARYYKDGRFYSLYGNHDMQKANPSFREKFFRSYCCEQLKEHPLCPHITFYSGIILKDDKCQKDIYLIHGHQADLWNSTFWQLSRFLVRYLWRPLEALGAPDPTSAAKNNHRKRKSEKVLTQWAEANGKLLVSGHTHRPMAGSASSPYYNTGSCVHPSGITGIEIEKRCLTLVKWSVKARKDMALYADREVLGEPVCIDEYV